MKQVVTFYNFYTSGEFKEIEVNSFDVSWRALFEVSEDKRKYYISLKIIDRQNLTDPEKLSCLSRPWNVWRFCNLILKTPTPNLPIPTISLTMPISNLFGKL